MFAKYNLLGALLVLVVAACVPASEPLPPAGAGGLQTDPSPAAKGEPFVSRDGWLVTIDKLIVRAGPQVQSQVPDRYGYSGYASSQPSIFNGKESGTQIYTPEIPPGPARVAVSYSAYSIFIGEGFSSYEDYADVFGSVTPADAARFTQVSDEGYEVSDPQYGYIMGYGPTVLIELHAAKDGGARQLKLKAAVTAHAFGAAFGFDDTEQGKDAGPGDKDNGDPSDEPSNNDKLPTPPSPPEQPSTSANSVAIEIRANALALARLEITPERAFTGAGGISIGHLAAADQNKDGEVTGAELAAVEVSTADVRSPRSDRKPTLLDQLADRLMRHLLRTREL